MKNIKLLGTKTLALLIFSIVIATSCKESYLEKLPLGNVSPETIFSTTKNATAVINGMHRYMYSQWYSQVNGGQGSNMLYMEALGEDFVMHANANGFFINPYKWLEHRNVSGNILRDNYGFYYAMISNANQILAYVDNAEGPQAVKDNLKAQALTYRGWSYFQMVQLFGKRYVAGTDNSSLGMSIVLEPSTESVPRSTVEQTYAQINKDLDDAIALFATSAPRANRSHLDISVARGVKARVALTQQNYEAAASFAKSARGTIKPMSQQLVMAGFSDYTNSEWMWGIQHRDDQPTYFFSYFAYNGNFASTNTRGNPKLINSILYSKISNTDIRKQLFDSTGRLASFPIPVGGVRAPYMNRKFQLANPGSSNGDLAFMRGAEMYLIEAEALARTGKNSEAADVLFELAKARDENYVKSVKTGQSLIDEILIQRRVELWGEGFRFYDLKRLNSDLNREGANHNATLANVLFVPAGDKRWEFLIPLSEIDRSLKVVEQNPL